MRPLTSSEKMLSIVTLIIIALIVTYALAFLLFDSINNISREISKLKSQLKETRFLLSEADLWQQREDWIKKTIVVAPQGGLATSELLSQVSQLAREHNVEIVNQSITQVDPDPQFTIAGIDLTIIASMENFIKWVQSFQKPEKLTGVTKISLGSDTDPVKIRANLRIIRYYAPQELGS